jgi:BirA family biotin operon repressor/biotin-[acetyl-CoA-carboxylase] ligase
MFMPSKLYDSLSFNEIADGLDPAHKHIRIIVKETTVSTNNDAKVIASEVADVLDDPVVIIADHQSGGRGRLGRSFESLSGSGIYMSILFRPDAMPAEMLTMFTVAAAVAVMRSIDVQCGVSTQVKWVNDIFLGGKKVCGILAEAVTSIESGGISHIIVGIGINFCGTTSDIPESLMGTAGYIFGSEDTARDAQTNRNKLISQITNEFFRIVHAFPDDSYMDEYISRSMLIGRRVTVHALAMSNGATHEDGCSPESRHSLLQDQLPARPATVMSVTRQGELEVEYEDGARELLRTGEVSVGVGVVF